MEYEILLEKNNEFMEENSRRITRKKREIMKLKKYAKAPVKMLTKARDMYVRSMNRLSDATAPGIQVGHVSNLPRSFSANHGMTSVNIDKTMSELMRVASVRKMIIERTEPESYKEPSMMMRNFSVGMAKIDEDKVCDFVPRMTKSYRVSNSNYTYAFI